MKRLFHGAAKAALPLIARLTRPLTMGVRAMVFDAQGRICLVRHSYVEGWHMPGGAIEPRETAHAALVREVHEETGLALAGEAELFGLYLNERMARRDHVALYVARAFTQTDHRPSRLEIREFGFFATDALPAETTEPTRRRVAEVLSGARPAPLW
ncbi:MAG: mismatch repair protein MutT [Pseudomonadota bacterium]|jgi:ADP-ribose pyrophosphatase YjhB (NUDIX family)